MKVCVLTDNLGVRRWAADAIEHMLASTDSVVSCVVVNESPEVGPPSFREAVVDGMSSSLQYFRNKTRSSPDYLQYQPLDSVKGIANSTHISTTPISANDKIGHEIPEDIVKEIVEKSDVVFRHGFGILRGQILTAPKHGVLSYHHGDIRKYRGAAQGFWNFVYDEPTAGVTLQQLTDELDGGRIVDFKQVDIESYPTYQEVRSNIFAASIPMLGEGVRKLSSESFEPKQVSDLGDFYTTSDKFQLGVMSQYLWKNGRGRLRSLLD